MDSIYENSGFILSTVASSLKPSQCNENSTEDQEREREVTSPKWIKVLLVVLGSSLVFALGGLFALWMLSPEEKKCLPPSASGSSISSLGSGSISKVEFLEAKIEWQEKMIKDLEQERNFLREQILMGKKTSTQPKAVDLEESENSGDSAHDDIPPSSPNISDSSDSDVLMARQKTKHTWPSASAPVAGPSRTHMRDNQKLADFESLNNQHIMISKQLSAQEINGTILIRELEECKSNYTRVREHFQHHDVMKKEFLILTARYNTLRKWLSFYDAQVCNLSVDGWIACRGKLYLFSSDKLNWSSSRDVCVSKDAKLVTITNQSEQNFLVSKIKQTHWIGLNDLETEGHWVWVNNQTLKETRVQLWFSEGPREPDNWKIEDPSGENCAALGDDNGNFQSWFDASCKKRKKFICEKKY